MSSESFEPEVAALCDELYDFIHKRRALTGSFIQKLNECDRALAPLLAQAQQELAAARIEFRAALQAQGLESKAEDETKAELEPDD